MTTVVLAGGTGGAKLARGMQDLGAELSVVANTGDDVEMHGVHVSPDPDLIGYWLCGEIDEERGWGIRGDSFNAFERLVQLGVEPWLRLSDRDLALCLRRRQLLEQGLTQTEAQSQIATALGVRAAVLPMCDEPVRTHLRTAGGWRGVQQYLILDNAKPRVEAVEFRGVDRAKPTEAVRTAIAEAEAIVIGPSNPVISIGPILAVPGMRDAIASSPAPTVAVSPLVAGRAVKGPTEKLMEGVGQPASAIGVRALYGQLIDGLVVDAGDPELPPADLPTLVMPTLMEGPEGRVEVARSALEFARSLS